MHGSRGVQGGTVGGSRMGKEHEQPAVWIGGCEPRGAACGGCMTCTLLALSPLADRGRRWDEGWDGMGWERRDS